MNDDELDEFIDNINTLTLNDSDLSDLGAVYLSTESIRTDTFF